MSLYICLFAKQTQTNCTELAYVFELSFQMCLCPKPATSSGIETSAYNLESGHYSLKYKGDPQLLKFWVLFGYCIVCKLDVKKFGKFTTLENTITYHNTLRWSLQNFA